MSKYSINPVGVQSEEEKAYDLFFDDLFKSLGLPLTRKSKDCCNPNTPGGSTPKQYSLPPGAKELQDLIEYRKMSFALGNIFKACYRFGTCSHSDKMRDVNKIIWFAERLKEELKTKE